MTAQSSAQTRICSHCAEWLIATGDLYCGGCGEISLELEVRPEQLILVSSFPNARRRRLLLSNQDGKGFDIEASFDPPRPWINGEPQTLRIEDGKKASIEVSLDLDLLPENFREEKVVCRLTFDGNAELTRDVPVLVRTGPLPRADPVIFGELREGTVERHPLVLYNDGGIPYRVESIKPFGSPQLQAELDGPVRVDPGRSVKLDVAWDTRIEDETELAESGFRLGLSTDETLEVPVRADVYRVRLDVEPDRLSFRTTQARTGRERVELLNRGTVDLEIESIESSEPWLRVMGTNRPIQLEAPDLSSDIPSKPFFFEVICKPDSLKSGKYEALIHVRIAGDDLEDLEIEVALELKDTRPYPDYVGIDFGTTNSVVSVLDEDGTPQLVRLDTDRFRVVGEDHDHEESENNCCSPLIFSLLCFREDGTTAIGPEAEALHRAAEKPEYVVRSIKRIMGTAEGIEISGTRYEPEELAAMILEHLVRYAEDRLLQVRQDFLKVQRAIVTVPANFWDLQIQAILDACEQAGIETDRDRLKALTDELKARAGAELNAGIILDEPSAAALYFLHYLAEKRSLQEKLRKLVDRDEGLRILVFDYGGGTLDISVARAERLESGGTGLRILASRGDNKLGGDTLDILLMRDRFADALAKYPDFDPTLISPKLQELQRRRKEEDWSDEAWFKLSSVRRQWKDAAEELKIQLSQEDQASVTLHGEAICHFDGDHVKGENGRLELKLSRSRMDDRLETSLDQAVELVEKTLEIAETSAHEIDFVFHAGRQSLMMAVQERVARIFHHLSEDSIVCDPDHLIKTCVAKGAALYGRFRDKGTKQGIRLIQERKLPHSYGIDHEGPFGVLEFHEVISRGAHYPTEAELSLDDLPVTGRLQLKLYQNLGNRSRIKDNPDIRQIALVEHTFDPKETKDLNVTFSIAADRRLTVIVGEREVDIKPVRPEIEPEWMG